MIFGGWPAITFDEQRKGLAQQARAENLLESGDFFVEVGQRGFEGFAVVRMGGGRQIVDNACAR
jgi:hypothetical protein